MLDEPRSDASPRLGRALLVAGALVALLAIGFGLRFVYTFSEMRAGGEYVHSVDPDPYYHLRRLEYAARNHGAPLTSDRFAAAPAEFRCPWPVAFDYLALGFHRLIFGGDDSHESLGLSAGFVPILLGLALVVLVFAVLWPRGGLGGALAGAAFVAACRESLSVSAFGMFDHHALEAIACLAIPAAFSAALRPGATPRRAELLGFVACGLGLLSADAVYIVVVATGAVMALHAIAPGGAAERWARVSYCAGATVGGALASALERGLGLDRALPHAGRIGLLLAVLGLPVIGLRGRRALAAGILLLIVGAALSGSMVLRGAAYLHAADPVSATIVQAQPLWVVGREWLPGALAALAAAAMVSVLRRGERRDHLLAAMALCGGALGIVQAKYSFLLAWTGAYGFGLGLAEVHARLSARHRRGFVVAAALAGSAWLGARILVEVREAPPGLRAEDRAFAELLPSLLALPPQASLVPGASPEWTIVAPPGEGPRILYVTGRAVTALPFWSAPESLRQYQDTSAVYAARDPQTLNALLRTLRARYLLVIATAQLDPASMAARLARGEPIAPTYRQLAQAGGGLYRLYAVDPR